MDRLGQFSSPLLGSFSLPSLAEGSEVISEAEEINEVKALHNQGIQAAKTSDFEEAVQYYNDALEIDSHDISVLQARALVYLQQGKTAESLKDAEAILGIDSNCAQGYLLQGLAHQQLNAYKVALDSMLSALDLDPKGADKITNHIAHCVSRFCAISPELMKSLKTMDPYEKLSEVGVVLYHHKKYEACISVLEASRQFQTNQKGITMKVLLTQANAHSQLLHLEVAIGLYQECLALAVATHEQAYQTKSLVNIASLHLENGDTHQAIIFYEKLLHLEAELVAEAGSREAMPEYWTRELECGLHLNLSIAYKTIGNMVAAVSHAKKYLALSQEFHLEPSMVGEANHNTGMLNEILGNYQEALQCYKEYLTLSKAAGNRKGMGQAYGCLASVYAALHNWSLSLSYHEQHIALATKAKDRKLTSLAHEMMGDTLCRKEDYMKAIDHYNQMMMVCRNRDNRGDATSRCKMAAAYKAMGQLQYSLYYYNEALSLAQRFGFKDIETLAEFHVALINKDSTQYVEREEAQAAFMRLIPFFEKKIAQHKEENSHCPEEYEQQLTQCYDGMQTVLSLMSNKFGCLQYAEAHRKRGVISLPNFQSTCRASNHSLDSSREIWGTDHMKRIVSEQNATVLYYSLMENLLLLWVIQPADGVTRFYTARSSKENKFTDKITKLIAEAKEGFNKAELYTTAEPRALPRKDAETRHLRTQNSRLKSARAKEKQTEESVASSENKKSPLRQLFDLLVAPVADILDKLEPQSHLVIVPDKQLKLCPFGAFLNYRNKPLSDNFNISYVPCLLLLDRVVQNEVSSLSAQGELEFQRLQAQKGGLGKQMVTYSEKLSLDNLVPDGDTTERSDSKQPSLNLREVSNPRLASSRTQGINSGIKLPLSTRSRESTFISTGGRSTREIPPAVPEDDVLEDVPKPSTRSLGLPTSLDKMLAVHTFSTLTTRTWTNTDVTSSSYVVPQYVQISDPRSALIFGCPVINQSVYLHGNQWMPKSELGSAIRELKLVAECLGSHPTMGSQATRQELLTRLETAEIVHLSTWACLKEGLLLVTPEPLGDQPDDQSHLVNISDILNLKLKAKLVVLSTCGLSYARPEQECMLMLATSFLSAGAESVLVCRWPIPDDALCKFFFHFYCAMQEPAFVLDALQQGVKALREDDRWSHPYNWACFAVIGKDTKICINEIRHALLDQMIDRCEAELEAESEEPILNPNTVVPNLCSKEENLTKLQEHMKQLLQNHYKNKRVIPGLVDLMDSALKRLHTAEINGQPSRLSDVLAKSSDALALLKWLGFHFQAKGAQLSCPYIIFPHWNTDDLLIPTYDALKAANDLVSSPSCVSAVCEALPLTQDNISCLIDLMSITKHAPEIQLKTTDLSVHPLWHYTKTRALLSTTGFHQVGLLLTFNMMSIHKQLLVSMLQLLLSFSCHKSPVLLFRLDVNLLGRASDTKSSAPEIARLPTLTPLILPRNQLRISTPWFSMIENREEMMEKMKLAKSTSTLSEEFTDYIERAKSWHQTTVVAQANEALDKYGRPASMSQMKVKVKSGSTASQRRVPVNEVKKLSASEIKQRRDYAHFVLQERVDDIDKRRKDNIIKLYLPYIKS